MRKMKLSTRLAKARALLIDPVGHTTGTFRRKSSKTADGFTYCALGACAAVSEGWTTGIGNWTNVGNSPAGDFDGRSEYSNMRRLLSSCAEAAGYSGIVSLNDSTVGPKNVKRTKKTRHADVLAAFDCAISKAKAAERAAK